MKNENYRNWNNESEKWEWWKMNWRMKMIMKMMKNENDKVEIMNKVMNIIKKWNKVEIMNKVMNIIEKWDKVEIMNKVMNIIEKWNNEWINEE